MIFPGINIKHKLLQERERELASRKEINLVLRESAERDENAKRRLTDSAGTGYNEITGGDNARCFSLQAIRKICIRYRLRFLPTVHFKAEFPYEAIIEINKLEKETGIKFDSFHIIAPEEAFDLENINKDPLLFAQTGEDSFYLLHQWGKDLKWHRRIFSWPKQSFKTLLISLFLIALIFVYCLPTSIMNVFNAENEFYLRAWLTLHTFIALVGFTVWAGLSFNKTLSEMNWRSKYYNY